MLEIAHADYFSCIFTCFVYFNINVQPDLLHSTAARKLVFFKFCLGLVSGCGELVVGLELVARWLLVGCCVGYGHKVTL